MKKRVGLAVGILVTTLSVLTMSSFAFGVLLGQFNDREALPCTEVPGTPQAFEGNRHLAYQNAPHDPYRTSPPTSGPHSPRVVIPGIYRAPIPPELQVHILEHGHVLLQYAATTSHPLISTAWNASAAATPATWSLPRTPISGPASPSPAGNASRISMPSTTIASSPSSPRSPAATTTNGATEPPTASRSKTAMQQYGGLGGDCHSEGFRGVVVGLWDQLVDRTAEVEVAAR